MRLIFAARLGGKRVVGLRINLLCLGSSILGLGSGIYELKCSLWTLGLWQGLDLLNLAFALILWSRTTLASPLTLIHLSHLALVTSLARPFGNLNCRKRGLGEGGCLEEIGVGATRGGNATGTSRMSMG
nr:hypothetical protein CFP56_65791 [Quercus suber]